MRSLTRRPLSAYSSLAALVLLPALLGVVPPARAGGPPESAAAVSLARLRTEYRVNPLGIDAIHPRFSWEIRADGRGVEQSAYRIQVAASASDLAAGRHLWDSGRVASAASNQIAYAGPDLRSGGRYAWRVRVWDGGGAASPWSAPATFEMGILKPSEWTARWIEPSWPEDTTSSQPPAILRGTFTVRGKVRAARAYITSHGLYEAELNGKPVSEDVFAPGWTSYGKQLQYQSYDVTDLVRQGENAIGATVGDGWYRGWLAWSNNRNTWGNRIGLLLQLRIEYADGREQVVGTDEGWKATTGPIRSSDIYMGEKYDARLERTGWSMPGYDAGDWKPVRVASYDNSILVAPAGPPVRRIQEIRPVRILHTPRGETVFDMGQNMVGWVRLRVRGPAGTTVTLRHAEVLDREGNFYTANLRAAKQTNQYTLRGGGEEVYEPHFTFQGFRYVAVDGFPGEPTLDALTGVVLHSDMTATGRFESSDSLLNQLQHNIVWGQKGNFVDVPTDCPQRDERLGWTGDAQVFSRTAAFNYDVAGFFTKWLRDLELDQFADGRVPHVIPDVLGRRDPNAGGSAAWADASTVIPWNMYLVYGDRRLLERQYPSMKEWVEYMRGRAGSSLLWTNGTHFGDWLAYATTRSDYPGATTDKDLIATAFFAHSTDLLQRAAKVLGKDADAAEYAKLFDEIRTAFQREYVTRNGRMSSNTQTAYALALQFDLLPESMRARAAERLVHDVRSFGNHLTTGFVGTPYLTHVLSGTGHADVAFDLLEQKSYPSWLYPVSQGATTIWERWDGQKPDGSFQDPGMNSFNHYAYGAIGDWMYRVVAGLELDPAEPGYKHLIVQPHVGGGLTHARAALETMYGEAVSGWTKEGERMTVEVVVPPNTHATVRLPGATLAAVREGGRAVAGAAGAPGVAGVTAARQDAGGVVVEVGSGRYSFAYPSAAPAPSRTAAR